MFPYNMLETIPKQMFGDYLQNEEVTSREQLGLIWRKSLRTTAWVDTSENSEQRL